MEKYDSSIDTKAHINLVYRELTGMAELLRKRAIYHDASKLESPEKEIFDEVTPRLKGLTYGSKEYKESLADMGPALLHHYENNMHHPEHYDEGIAGMDLIDLLEMICDWYVATKRHEDGDIYKSLKINEKRFGISSQLTSILTNTVNRYLVKE